MNGRNVSNVLHGNLTVAGPINPASAETIFSAIKGNSATTALLAMLGPTAEFSGVAVKDMRTPNMGEYRSSSLPAPGTGTGTMIPLNGALVVTLRTAQSGQGFRGRVYIAGWESTALSGPLDFTGAAGAAAKAFVDGVNTVMTAQGIPMVVAQRSLAAGTHHDGTPWAARPSGVLPVISTDIANPRIDSQRRRLGR
jgi:hypothetical protein